MCREKFVPFTGWKGNDSSVWCSPPGTQYVSGRTLYEQWVNKNYVIGYGMGGYKIEMVVPKSGTTISVY